MTTLAMLLTGLRDMRAIYIDDAQEKYGSDGAAIVGFRR
jgi:hypothetical protein